MVPSSLNLMSEDDTPENMIIVPPLMSGDPLEMEVLPTQPKSEVDDSLETVTCGSKRMFEEDLTVTTRIVHVSSPVPEKDPLQLTFPTLQELKEYSWMGILSLSLSDSYPTYSNLKTKIQPQDMLTRSLSTAAEHQSQTFSYMDKNRSPNMKTQAQSQLSSQMKIKGSQETKTEKKLFELRHLKLHSFNQLARPSKHKTLTQLWQEGGDKQSFEAFFKAQLHVTGHESDDVLYKDLLLAYIEFCIQHNFPVAGLLCVKSYLKELGVVVQEMSGYKTLHYSFAGLQLLNLRVHHDNYQSSL
ncbi:hypothetical protein OTU49_007624, partial [Cherax quadricarinatus]